MVQNRIANAVYDSCRAGNSVLPNFPSYDPVVQALRENGPSTNDVNYKVCISKPDGLVILQSFARKWLEYEDTKDEANRVIQEHNDKFNAGGEFMEDDERIGVPNLNWEFHIDKYHNDYNGLSYRWVKPTQGQMLLCCE